MTHHHLHGGISIIAIAEKSFNFMSNLSKPTTPDSAVNISSPLLIIPTTPPLWPYPMKETPWD
jgi:hypothetical protein